MRSSLSALLLLSALCAPACAKSTMTSDAPAATCTKAGQQCRYAEGKIGLCTSSTMDCDGGSACLVCMSLH